MTMPSAGRAGRLLVALTLLHGGAVPAAAAGADVPEAAADADAAAAPAGVAWVTPVMRGPGVTHHTFASAAAGTRVSYHLFTPRAHDREPARRFPVVYWLHGSGGGLVGIPNVARRFDAAIESGRVPPLFVVFVNGLREGMYVDWQDGSAPVETVIVRDLVPHVDATHRTIARREGRLLDGFSMGGYGAARLGFKYPELFRAVSIVGAGPLQPDLLAQAPRAGRQRAAEVLERVYGGDRDHFAAVGPRTLAERNARIVAAGSLVRIVIGDADATFANNRDFHEHLTALGIPHAWTVLPGIGHDPAAVLDALGEENWTFYRTAFGAGGDAPETQAAPAAR